MVREEMTSLVAGRYSLEKLLGRGGMAEVFEALDQNTGRRVALKRLLPQHRGERPLTQRFLDESVHLRSIDHPNIVKVLDAGEDAGGAFVALELARGGSLEDWLDGLERPLPPRVVAHLALTIASALAHAHAQGIIHQDLKPSNILFRTPPDPDQKVFDLFISDFGQARTVALASMTGSSLAWGTPAYTAPELLRGDGADPRSDLFSLGVVMFEALTLQMPWDARTPLARLLDQVPASPLDSGDLEIDFIVERLLELKPAHRLASAHALAEVLSGRQSLPPRERESACSKCHTPKPDDLRVCPNCGNGALEQTGAHAWVRGTSRWHLILRSLDRNPESLDRLHALLREATGLQDVALNIDGRGLDTGRGKKTALAATLFSNMTEAEARAWEARFLTAGFQVKAAKGGWGKTKEVWRSWAVLGPMLASAVGFSIPSLMRGSLLVPSLLTNVTVFWTLHWTRRRKLARTLFPMSQPAALAPEAHAALARVRALRRLGVSSQVDDLLRQLAEALARLTSRWSGSAPAEAWQSLGECLTAVERGVQRLAAMERVLRSESDLDLVRAIGMARHRLAAPSSAGAEAEPRTLAALEQALAARQRLFQSWDHVISQLCLLLGHTDALNNQSLSSAENIKLLQDGAQTLTRALANG